MGVECKFTNSEVTFELSQRNDTCLLFDVCSCLHVVKATLTRLQCSVVQLQRSSQFSLCLWHWRLVCVRGRVIASGSACVEGDRDVLHGAGDRKPFVRDAARRGAAPPPEPSQQGTRNRLGGEQTPLAILRRVAHQRMLSSSALT